MPSLSIIYCPAFSAIAKCLLEVLDLRATDSYLQQLSLVHEDFEVVSSALDEPLIPKDSLEPTSLF